MPGTRKLGRPTASRLAMLRAMVTFLLENGRIETTVTRAKEVRSMTEKMITIAKNPTLANKRQVMAFVTKESVCKKLFDEFVVEYQHKGETHSDYSRFKSHFIQWARIALQKRPVQQSPAQPQKRVLTNEDHYKLMREMGWEDS